MKKHLSFIIFVVSFIGFIVLGCYAVFISLKQPDTPEKFALIVEPNNIDFGLAGETTLIKTVHVTNQSKYAVNILDVAATCSCSQVMLKKGEIAPGKTIDAELSLDTHGRSGEVSGRIAILYQFADSKRQGNFVTHINLHATVETQSRELLKTSSQHQQVLILQW
ncbi:MAG: DUF1573 domain-containing protein [Planctomycetaceae bacterium]|nr:DUF1573 domain-containing protein [Planctomycetaceae bacterium]